MCLSRSSTILDWTGRPHTHPNNTPLVICGLPTHPRTPTPNPHPHPAVIEELGAISETPTAGSKRAQFGGCGAPAAAVAPPAPAQPVGGLCWVDGGRDGWMGGWLGGLKGWINRWTARLPVGRDLTGPILPHPPHRPTASRRRRRPRPRDGRPRRVQPAPPCRRRPARGP